MIKTGSKLYYALAGLSFLAAILYAGFTGDHKLGMDTLLGPITFGWKGYVGEHVGYSVLMSAAFVSLTIAILLSAVRDADPERAAKVLELPAAPPAAVPVSVNYWPVIGAFSVGCMALGLAVGPVLFVIGVIGVVASLVEWTVRAWSDRATGDAELNRSLRSALLGPFELPIGGLLILGGIVLGMSRILLALPSAGSIAVFGAVPAMILAVGALVALRPKLSQSFIAAAIVVGALALLVGGTIAAVVGERDHDTHPAEQTGSAPITLVVEVGN
ncbi:MAG: hypothetical protein KDB02_00190 [Acidimicrobiales bacterium]|nr:hypothetical protein [Acidimicrobiales bacterium]